MCVANQKGGVGKTTTVANLGGLLAEQGQRVLMLDLDPHGSLSAYFGLDPDLTAASVADLFNLNGKVPPHPRLVTPTEVDNLHLLPAAAQQATLDRELASKGGMGLVLTEVLKSWRRQFDHVLLDCPPTLGVLMINALAACDRVLIPVQTDYLALQGLKRMTNTLGMVGASLGYDIAHTIIPTFFDTRTRASRAALQDLRNEFSANLWPGAIPIDTKFRDASRQGLPLNLFAPNSRGTLAYRNLFSALQDDATTHHAGSLREAV